MRDEALWWGRAVGGTLWVVPEPPRRVWLSALCERARKLYQEMLGEDHADTLGPGGNPAVALRAAGDYERVREFDQDTLTHRRRVLGEDHPQTLVSAHNLALDLRGWVATSGPGTSSRTP
jgi:hypothetical protein